MKFKAGIILFSALIAASCTRSDREHLPAEDMFLGVVPYDQFKPIPYRKRSMEYMPADNSSYAQGYQDGCRSFSSAVAEGLYRTHGPKFDANKLSDDPWYLRGFEDAATACTFVFDWELH
jgi:hypothetical protein